MSHKALAGACCQACYRFWQPVALVGEIGGLPCPGWPGMFQCRLPVRLVVLDDCMPCWRLHPRLWAPIYLLADRLKLYSAGVVALVTYKILGFALSWTTSPLAMICSKRIDGSVDVRWRCPFGCF